MHWIRKYQCHTESDLTPHNVGCLQISLLPSSFSSSAMPHVQTWPHLWQALLTCWAYGAKCPAAAFDFSTCQYTQQTKYHVAVPHCFWTPACFVTILRNKCTSSHCLPFSILDVQDNKGYKNLDCAGEVSIVSSHLGVCCPVFGARPLPFLPASHDSAVTAIVNRQPLQVKTSIHLCFMHGMVKQLVPIFF